VVVTRNGSSHLTRTIDSLLKQTTAAIRITVVDDGSSDDTPKILREYQTREQRVAVLTKPDRGYDIRRVPANINLACAANTHLDADFFMISGDDCKYPSNYAASLLARMAANSRIVVASGRPSTHSASSREHSPSGSGRIVSCVFWRDVGSAYPVRAGWETWLLYVAAEKGFQVQLFDDLTFEHERPRGTGHQFVYWGAAMEVLGYHPLYAMGRIAVNAMRPSLAPKRALNMFRGYLQAKLGSSDKFIEEYDMPLRSFIKLKQSQRMSHVVGSRVGMVSGSF